MTAVGSILRKATRKEGERLNVLSWVTHERWQSNLAKCNCNFYLLQNGPGIKGMWKVEYAAIPRNTTVLPPYQNNPMEVVPPDVDIDVIFSHHKFGMIQTALQLSQMLKIPTVNIEHTMVTSPELERDKPKLKELRGNINVFITAFSRNNWGFSEEEAEVIEHGVDSNLFKPNYNKRESSIVTVGNDMLNRGYILGWDIAQRVILANNLPLTVIGDTKGFSLPAQNVFDLVSKLNMNTIYFNPSRLSPVPMSLLEAMSCGLCPVSLDNCLISELIVDGVNGYKSNDENVLLSHLRRLLADKEEAIELGRKARETIIQRFPLNAFITNWNNVFERAANL